MKSPDPEAHFKISLLKSGIRIVGVLLSTIALTKGIVPAFLMLGVSIVIAECLGVLEELI